MNNRAKPGFLSEHGFSAWVECGDQRILFDAGGSDALVHNAERLAINLATTTHLVLSHGHYDHTGYVAELLAQHPHIHVLMHPKATEQRYSIHPDIGPRDISMPPEARSAIQAHDAKLITATGKPHKLQPCLGSTGAIARTHPLEDPGGPFFMDDEGLVPDLIEDDLALWIKTPRGLVVVTGCCHAGIINTVKQIKTITSATTIYAILGGLHLKAASDPRLAATLEALKEWNPDYLIPCHCTGDKVIDCLQRELGYHVKPGYSGMQLMINPQISTLTEETILVGHA